jgi:hypothetical protein
MCPRNLFSLSAALDGSSMLMLTVFCGKLCTVSSCYEFELHVTYQQCGSHRFLTRVLPAGQRSNIPKRLGTLYAHDEPDWMLGRAGAGRVDDRRYAFEVVHRMDFRQDKCANNRIA